jgi:hypothetical protein
MHPSIVRGHDKNRRSLGFAQDDRKERAVVRRVRLLKERVVAEGQDDYWRETISDALL